MKRWLKGIVIVLAIPVLLFAIVFILLYIPPLQNYLKEKAVSYVSEQTDMDLTIGRISLTFPFDLLVKKVQVVQRQDTLLTLDQFSVNVSILPLFQGQVVVNAINLKNVSLNSSGLIKGMCVKGSFGELHIRARRIDFKRQIAIINNIDLKDARIKLCMADMVEKDKDTTATPFRWRAELRSLKLRNVSFDMIDPKDSLHVLSVIKNADARDAKADFNKQVYTLSRFSLSKSSFEYIQGRNLAKRGINPSHIAVRNLDLKIHSLESKGKKLNGVISNISFVERSGLNITSLSARIYSNDKTITVPQLQIETPYSNITLSAKTDWETLQNSTKGIMQAKLNAHIGLRDVLFTVGKLPGTLSTSNLSRSLNVRLAATGNMKYMQLSECFAEVPEAFSLSVSGGLISLTDSLKRSAALIFHADTKNFTPLLPLFGISSKDRLVIPYGLKLNGKVSLRGSRYIADMLLTERKGKVRFKGNYNDKDQSYSANLDVQKLSLHSFLPKDSLYSLSASLSAKGRGTDVFSARTFATVQATLSELHYASYSLSHVNLDASLKKSVGTVSLVSRDSILPLQLKLNILLSRSSINGTLLVDAPQVDLYKLRLTDKPSDKPFPFTLKASADKGSTSLNMNSGDLNIDLKSTEGVKQLLKESSAFANLLVAQLKRKKLGIKELQRLLPDAQLSVSAGKDNLMSDILAKSTIYFDHFALDLTSSALKGINGKASLTSLNADSLIFDKINLTLVQDTSGIRFLGNVANEPSNKQLVFSAKVDGHLSDKEGEILLTYLNEGGQTGILLGCRATLDKEGLKMKLFPSEPILAFRSFLLNDDNYIYIDKAKKIKANLNLTGKDGMLISLRTEKDSLAKLKLIAGLQKINISEFIQLVPNMPNISGVLSANLIYTQRTGSFDAKGDATVSNLAYETQSIGNIRLNFSYLPDKSHFHHLDAKLYRNEQELITAIGTYRAGENENLDSRIVIKSFPLNMVNPFIPDKTVLLAGTLNGEVTVNGKMNAPQIDGRINLDTASVFIPQVALNFRLDTKPIMLTQSHLLFDHYSIFTRGDNPLVVDGQIDVRDPAKMMADLKLNATNYQLLDAKLNKESLVYGKIFIDLTSTLKGPLNALVMRGNINLLGNTDFTYVLKDSPIMVKDRLGDMVTFVDFNDIKALKDNQSKPLSLGGLDMLITIHIDPAVKMKADLSADRESRVELEGGGDISFQYTPQGDFSLSGRYTLSDGLIRYSMPVIPLKSFKIQKGSSIDWSGNVANPLLDITSVQRVRASVTTENEASRMVNFDVTIAVKNKLENLGLVFDVSAPEDLTIQNQLSAMSDEERSKQALTLLATGMYTLNASSTGKGGGLNMGSALNSFLQDEIANIAGSALKTVDVTVGVESYDANVETGSGKRTDYSFRFAKRFYNDRFNVVIGGRISTGDNTTQNQSFIDNISLEYRLDNSGTRYVRLFHNKNYESLLEGEITETGVGLVLRKKMVRLGELFIFRKKETKNDAK